MWAALFDLDAGALLTTAADGDGDAADAAAAAAAATPPAPAAAFTKALLCKWGSAAKTAWRNSNRLPTSC